MKKQFLFPMLFLLAILAGITNSRAQTTVLTPRILQCEVAEGPLNPLLGKTYTYSVDIPNVSEFTDGVTYRWVVTQDQTFITAGALTASVEVSSGIFTHRGGSDYNDDGTGASSNTIDISWNSLPADANNPFFLIIKADGDRTICTATNTKVYMIVPKNQFTLDIVNVDPIDYSLKGFNSDSTAVHFDQCFSDIVSAYWNAGTQDVAYDYGEDSLIWAVAAANWTTSWTPSLQIDTVGGGSYISSVVWNTAADGSGTGGTFTDSGADLDGDGLNEWTTSTDVTPVGGTTTDLTSGNVGADGETIYIIMVLDHTDPGTGHFNEGLNDIDVTLAIDGVTANGDSDVHLSDTFGVGGCGNPDGFDNDFAEQTVKQRPEVDSTTNGGADDFLTPVSVP